MPKDRKLDDAELKNISGGKTEQTRGEQGGGGGGGHDDDTSRPGGDQQVNID